MPTESGQDGPKPRLVAATSASIRVAFTAKRNRVRLRASTFGNTAQNLVNHQHWWGRSGGKDSGAGRAGGAAEARADLSGPGGRMREDRAGRTAHRSHLG